MYECGEYEVYVKEIVVFNYILEEHSTCKCNRSSQKVTFQSKLALFSTDL